MDFSIKDFFSKCDQTHTSLMQNFIFRASVKTSLDEFLLLFYDVFFYNYFIEFVSPF